MHTGEYRGFVGQFPVWLHGQVVTWRMPLLLSLCLHVLLFWPKSLQENGFGAQVALSPSTVQARLRPGLPARPEAQVRHEAAVRPVAAPQSSSGLERSSPVKRSEEVISAEASRSGLQPTPGLDAGAVRAYRIAWARALMGSRLRESLSADMQGALEVGVAVAASGQISDIAVLKGSGVSALDAAVITAMRNAMQAVPLPPAMRGREFVLAVPVEVGPVATTSVVGR